MIFTIPGRFLAPGECQLARLVTPPGPDSFIHGVKKNKNLLEQAPAASQSGPGPDIHSFTG